MDYLTLNFNSVIVSLVRLDAQLLTTLGGAILGILLTFVIFRAFYNVFLHPLARYPGSILWSSTAIPYNVALINGTIHVCTANLHQRYGPVVRISPNELSYISPQAWTDIYVRKYPHQLKKHPDVTSSPAGGTPGLANTPVDRDHARIRQELIKGFSQANVKAQEERMIGHVEHLVAKIAGKGLGPHDNRPQDIKNIKEADLTQLLSATTYDIITDLTFGESTDALEKGTDWAGLVTSLTKSRIMFIILSNYVPVIVLLMRRIFPNLVPAAAAGFIGDTNAYLDRRLAHAVDHKLPDFITPVLPSLDTPKGVSLEELRATLITLPFLIRTFTVG
ncbi:hypothetical protein BBP40_008548 [Aspergillus hancockii]|nr:hypothetical protein BBP40_008548 [Aspergillus hancockii]